MSILRQAFLFHVYSTLFHAIPFLVFTHLGCAIPFRNISIHFHCFAYPYHAFPFRFRASLFNSLSFRVCSCLSATFRIRAKRHKAISFLFLSLPFISISVTFGAYHFSSIAFHLLASPLHIVFSSRFSYTVYTGTATPSNPERNINHVTSFTPRIGFIFFRKYVSSKNTILRFITKEILRG